MWAAFKALVQQEGTCAPSGRSSHKKEGDSKCEARTALDADRSHQKKSSKKGRKKLLDEPTTCSEGVLRNYGIENSPNPNLPLPHVTSPAVSPCKDDDRAPRIEAQAWRVRAATPKALSVWEVRRILLYEPGKETSSNGSVVSMTCSASASDDEWGQLQGWEVANAFGGPNSAGHGWGGRPDKTWEIWLGAEWGTPLQVERVKILQGENRGHSFRSGNRGASTAESVFIEAQLEDGSWGLVAGPVPINEDGWTTIQMCCAGAKRHRTSGTSNPGDFPFPSTLRVPTPALRLASPHIAQSGVHMLSDAESTASRSTGRSEAESTTSKSTRQSGKKVTFTCKDEPQAFPSLGF